jgi:hypothetical protein
MTRCADFYKKWEKEPNWCEKCKSTVSLINNYLDLVTELNNRGIDREVIYAKFPETAARPVFTIKDPEIRNKTLNYTCSCLNRAEKVQAGDLKNLISAYNGKEKKEKPVEDRPEEFAKVNSFTPVPEVKQVSSYQPQPNSIPVTNDPAMRPLSEIADLSKLAQLSPDAPMDEVRKRDELLLKIHNVPSEFKTGSEIQKEVINGGLVTKPLPYKISPEPMTEKEADELILQVINRWFAPKSKELWETILASGELSDSPARLFEAMVCRIGGE